MSDDADKSKLSEAQKSAKHDYSIHQDNLFWSRVQTLMAIQTGTLAGSYYLAYEKQDNLEVAWCLTALGVILTALLWIIAERDQLHRHKSLLASEVPETIINPGFPLNLNGGSAVRGVILLLAFADIALPLFKTVVGFAFWPFLFMLALLVVMTWRVANKIADEERNQLS